MIEYIFMIIVVSIALIIIGVLLMIIDSLRRSRVIDYEVREKKEEFEEEKKRKIRGGGVVLIGPFPIIFGTDKDIIKWAIILTIIVVSIFIVFSLTMLGVVKFL